MKIFILNVCLLMSFNSFAKGGDEVRNGGGLAEQYLAFALENLDVAIELCLAKPECGKNAEGRSILTKIKEVLPEERNAQILKFESERKKPGFFLIDGVVRLAITGSKVGDPIYYNLDLLYVNNEPRMTLAQATQSLIHELGHHLGYFDHEALELLGAEVRSFNEGNVNDVPYLPHLQSIGFAAIGTETRSFFNDGNLSLVFSNKIVDLSRHFSSVLTKCTPSTIGPLASSSFQFFNLHWDHRSVGGTVKGEKILAGNLMLYCKHKYLQQNRKLFKFEIAVKVNFAKNFIYISDRLMSEPEYVFTIAKDSVITHQQ